ncbi:MAG: hypothetical protein WDW38_011466 [Sanguina aurantia]
MGRPTPHQDQLSLPRVLDSKVVTGPRPQAQRGVCRKGAVHAPPRGHNLSRTVVYVTMCYLTIYSSRPPASPVPQTHHRPHPLHASPLSDIITTTITTTTTTTAMTLPATSQGPDQTGTDHDT